MDTDLPPEGRLTTPPLGPRTPEPAHEPEPEAPILSLDEARQRRVQQQQEAQQAAERRRKRERHVAQLRILQDTLYDKRLDSADLMDMIKLGLVTDDEEMLPCRCRSRREHFYDWENKYYTPREDRREPDEELIRQLHEQLARGYDPAVSQKLYEEYAKRMPEATEVCCPLQAYEERDGVLPPCAYVLKHRSKMEWDRETGKLAFHPIPADENDPVVAAAMHPCAVIGRELYTTIMLPVWLRERDDDDEDE
jgi:hypothetical protein